MMRPRTLSLCIALALTARIAIAAAPQLDDYAQGVAIEVLAPQPIVQLDLPDVVYQNIVTDDLSDVRVFNADGVAVPHAVCALPKEREPTISQETLPVYRLQDIKAAASDGTRVEVQTPNGAQISVQGDSTREGESQKPAYVIDARSITDEMRALQFDWSSPDGASEVRVSIQASADLDRWDTLIARSTLLSVKAGEEQLRRHRVAIPQGHYEYLRIERVDRGPPLQLDGVIAERVTPAPIIEPVWFSAMPTKSTEQELVFDAARHAPVTYARLQPAIENISWRVAIDSRDDPKASWATQWSGESYSIATDTQRKVSPPAEFAPTTARFWRVRLTNKSEAFSPPPTFELGYRPSRLRFLAQGAGPYTLAFGSRRADAPTPRSCDSLLTGMKREELESNIGEGIAGAQRKLGGDTALRPLPKQTPIRQFVLWGVLVVGVGALVAMALSLLRRVNTQGK